ncbi:LysR family transcriptional regulator [Sulfitobacter sp. SK012]|uniref:LysR family transcriptional regulator n=1 Tax=Sulfitobacter sp. SK012 TaxID=1389005 RepID=UPI000E0B409A|nr:LysR family transcriptional regulator [Sulfitobacter sp. SK012]AXI45757.1 LysR family transcriptional regulator [Sulfitobacter sp. SK012]
MNWKDLPSLTSLKAFAVAAEHQNLTKAAAVLNVTHSAISQQIRTLERHLGIRLFTRTQHGISLTSQGEYLAAGLLNSFASMSSVLENMADAENSRPLLVSATPMFSSAFLMPRMSDFLKTHPKIELNIQSTIEAVILTPGGVDMAIRYGTGNWPGLDAHLVLPGCLTVVASRELVRDRVFRHPRELLEYPLLQEQASVEFDLWLEKVGVPIQAPRKVVRLPGNMLVDGVRRGDGISATVPAFIADELKTGEIVTLFDDPIPEIGYYLVALPGTQRPALTIFRNWLEKSVSAYERGLYRWPPAHLL